MADVASTRELEAQLQRVRTERVSALTRACLSTPKPGLSAQPNGPPVSPLDYVVARVAQAGMLAAGGPGVASDSVTRRQAQNTAMQLESLLDRMLDSTSGGALDPAALMAAWGPALQQFDAPGLNVSGFVADALKTCHRQAELTAARETRNPATELGALYQQILDARR